MGLKVVSCIVLIFACYSLCDQAVSVTATPSSKYLLQGVLNTLTVSLNITVDSPEIETIQRPPFELAIVLDRSGSMNGAKIAKAKQAVKNIIYNLSPKDRLHFVIYDDTVDVVFRDGHVEQMEQLLAKVDQVVDRGMTNLHAGLQRGYEMLSSSQDRVKRVFLFSDGLVNMGVTNHKTILELTRKMHTEFGVSTSSFGIGSDFDETLMTGIAEHGAGNYYFIDEEKDIERIVNLGLKTVTNLLADNVRLFVQGKNGATVTKVFGFEPEGLVSGIQLADIRKNTRRNLLLQLEVIPHVGLTEDVVLEYELTYNLVREKKPEVVSGSLNMPFTDQRDLAAEQNTLVEELLSLQLATEQENEAIKALEEGDYERANILQEEASRTYDLLSTSTTMESVAKNAQVKSRRLKETQHYMSTSSFKEAKMQASYNARNNMVFDEADEEL